MDFLLRIPVGVLLGLLLSAQTSLPTNAEITKQIERLNPKSNDKMARLEALRWIGVNTNSKNVDAIVPALEQCIRKDPETELRQRALSELCNIMRRLKRPYPLIAIEMLLDPVEFVRYQAAAYIPIFKTFAPGSKKILLRGVVSEDAGIRSNCLLILARVAPKDPAALAAMQKATHDKVFDVRHCAHLALFHAKDDLPTFLTYMIRMREDPASVLSPVPADSKIGKQERIHRNLFVVRSGTMVIDWSENRANEFASVLIKLLSDKSAVLRRGAANLIGASVQNIKLPQMKWNPNDPASFPSSDWGESILPFIDPQGTDKVQKKTPPAKSKVALRLEKLGVEKELRKMRDGDPDAGVRAAAAFALERLAWVNNRKP